MLQYIFSHIRRKIVATLCVILVASLISASFCLLEELKQSEQENYEQMYRNIRVTASVSDLTGRNTDNLEAPYWAVDVFFPGGKPLPDTLNEYATDVQAKTTWRSYDYQKIDQEDVNIGDVVGLTSTEAEPQLRKNNGGIVTWFEGFDDSILSGNEPVCLLPEELMPDSQENVTVSMSFSRVIRREEGEITLHYQLDLKVAGTYRASEQKLYIPYRQAESIWSAMKQELIVDSVKVTIEDNDLLDKFRDASSAWFAHPDLRGRLTPWGKMDQEYYTHALVIDDSQLLAAQNLLNKSIQINSICRQILFFVSAGVGFLVGFLIIRSRKREITLMRTMGTPNRSIYVGFAMEQLLYVILGTAFGCANFQWKPLNQLLMFVTIYAVGLSLALVIFLRKNLMSTMRDDE